MGFVKVRAMCIWVMVVQFTDQTSSDLPSERPHRIFYLNLDLYSAARTTWHRGGCEGHLRVMTNLDK